MKEEKSKHRWIVATINAAAWYSLYGLHHPSGWVAVPCPQCLSLLPHHVKHRIDIKELEGMQDSMLKDLRERDVQLNDIQMKLDKCQEAKVRLLL